MALKLRRGLEADRTSILPAEGELIYTTDQKQLFVGDGTTAGGTLVSSAVVSVNGINGVVSLTTDDIDEGVSNLYYSDTYARAAISVTGAGGSYDSGTGVITLTGGGGGSSDSFKTITVAGQNNVVADSATDTLTLVAGTNITITTNDTTDTITINSTASSSVENLDDLLDVDAASPGGGQALVWNSGTSTWQAADVGSGTVSASVIHQLAWYSDTYEVTGSDKFSIDDDLGALFVNGNITTPSLVLPNDSDVDAISVNKFHSGPTESTITATRARGTQLAPTAVQAGDGIFVMNVRANNGIDYNDVLRIVTETSYVVEAVEGLEATLSLGTAVVTLTTGDTSGLSEGQYVSKTAGVGEFGVSFGNALEDFPAYIVSIDGPTQITLNANHTAAGAVTFRSGGVTAGITKFFTESTDGHDRPNLRIKDDGRVHIGPDIGDFDGDSFNGKLNITSQTPSDHEFDKAMLRLISTGSTANGQEINFTRARGTITQGGLGFALTAVQTGDELGSLAFYGWYEPNPGGDNLESSRILAEVTGTVTGSAIPGKLKLQNANSSGVMVDSLSLTATAATFAGSILVGDGTVGAPSIGFSTDGGTDTGFSHPSDGTIVVSTDGVEALRFDNNQMTTFSGMAKVATYADETAAEAAVDGSPTNGMMYYDTGANAAKMYGNGTWHTLW